MEIHVPDRPISGWRETVKHLSIITAGVLIALALEGLVTWVDHRMLVREAVANLTAELQTNQKELSGLFPALQKEQQQLEHLDDVLGIVSAGKPLQNESISLESHGAELKNAAVTTGQITGAFGYMEYSEVRRYADVYDLQAQFLRLQEREGQHFSDVLAFARRVPTVDHPNAETVERWRAVIDVAVAGVVAREQLARQLQRRYEEILAEH
jgi:hypothetical protein